MARLTFPDDRTAFRPARNGQPIRSAASASVTVYLDPAATQLAADLTYLDGTPIVGGELSVDAWSQIPLFNGPDDGTDTLYVVIDAGPATAVYARADDRLDALDAGLSPRSSVPSTITYNADGTVATVTENDTGAVVTYTYNTDGLPATESRLLNGVTTLRTFTYTNGNLTAVA